MERVPYIAFNVKKYNGFNEMMYDVRNAMCVLINNGYEVVFRYEDAGIYILEYGYDDASLGAPMAYWLTPDDYYDFMCLKENDDEEVLPE